MIKENKTTYIYWIQMQSILEYFPFFLLLEFAVLLYWVSIKDTENLKCLHKDGGHVKMW